MYMDNIGFITHFEVSPYIMLQCSVTRNKMHQKDYWLLKCVLRKLCLSDCLSNCPWMFLPKRQYTRHNIPMYPIRTNQNKYLLLESIILGSIVHHTSCAVQTNWIPFLWLYGTVKLNTHSKTKLAVQNSRPLVSWVMSKIQPKCQKI